MTFHIRDRAGRLAQREPVFVAPGETLRKAANKL